MSGHSKWAKIKGAKGAADAKKGAIFSKLSKSITMAARGGADPSANFSLRLAIDKAKGANMPKDNIDRAIARGSGEDEGAILQTVLYQALGPGGIAMIIQAVTDNPNRTNPVVRTILQKHGAQADAQVLWQFARMGVVRAKGKIGDLELALIDAGAEDIQPHEDDLEIISGLGDLQAVEKAAREGGLTIVSAEPEYIAANKVPADESTEEKIFALLELLEDNDDVDQVFTNLA